MYLALQRDFLSIKKGNPCFTIYYLYQYSHQKQNSYYLLVDLYRSTEIHSYYTNTIHNFPEYDLYHLAKVLNPFRSEVDGLKPKSISNGVVSAYVTGTSPGCMGTSSL